MNLVTKISGDQELLKVFQKLPRTTRTRAIRPALREGAKFITKLARKNVKMVAIKGYATDTLVKNIRFYNFKDLRGMARVGIRVKKGAVNTKKIVKGQPVRIGLYAAVLEYGKENQAPASWIRKSIKEGETQAVSLITTGLDKRMVDAIEKAKK